MENQQQIILAGHYRNKSSIGSETEKGAIELEVIRIIGENPKRKGYFTSIDNKDYSEWELTENWEYMVIQPTEKAMSNYMRQNQTKKSKLFADFDQLATNSNSDTEVDENQTSTVSNHIEYQIETPENSEQTSIIREPVKPQISEKDLFINNIMNKLTSPIPTQIEITLSIPLSYNIDKLRDSINLLNIDTNDITKHIVSEINIKNIQNLLSLEIMKLLLQQPVKHQIQQPIQQFEQLNVSKETTNIGLPNMDLNIIDEKQLEKEQKLDSAISLIDDIINNINTPI